MKVCEILVFIARTKLRSFCILCGAVKCRTVNYYWNSLKTCSFASALAYGLCHFWRHEYKYPSRIPHIFIFRFEMIGEISIDSRWTQKWWRPRGVNNDFQTVIFNLFQRKKNSLNYLKINITHTQNRTVLWTGVYWRELCLADRAFIIKYLMKN